MKIMGQGQPKCVRRMLSLRNTQERPFTRAPFARGNPSHTNARNSCAVNRLHHKSRTPGVGVASSLSSYNSGMRQGLLRTGEIGLARANVIVTT